MEGAARKKRFTWSEQQTFAFIRLRREKEEHFTGHRNASIQGFALVLKEMSLEELVTPAQASKKWENLKRKYRDLIQPRTGSKAEPGDNTPANWPYFEEMHRAMGDEEAVKPLNPAIMAAVDQARPPSPGPSTSADPPPGSPRPRAKRKNEVLEYLKEYAERQEKRQREMDARKEERERRREEQLDTLIALFAKFVDNHK